MQNFICVMLFASLFGYFANPALGENTKQGSLKIGENITVQYEVSQDVKIEISLRTGDASLGFSMNRDVVITENKDTLSFKLTEQSACDPPESFQVNKKGKEVNVKSSRLCYTTALNSALEISERLIQGCKNSSEEKLTEAISADATKIVSVPLGEYQITKIPYSSPLAPRNDSYEKMEDHFYCINGTGSYKAIFFIYRDPIDGVEGGRWLTVIFQSNPENPAARTLRFSLSERLEATTKWDVVKLEVVDSVPGERQVILSSGYTSKPSREILSEEQTQKDQIQKAVEFGNELMAYLAQVDKSKGKIEFSEEWKNKIVERMRMSYSVYLDAPVQGK